MRWIKFWIFLWSRTRFEENVSCNKSQATHMIMRWGGGGNSYIWAASWQNQKNDCPQRRLISLGSCLVWLESSLYAQWVAKDSSFLHADSEDWSDWADAQAELSLGWVHAHFIGFVVSRLVFIIQYIRYSMNYRYITPAFFLLLNSQILELTFPLSTLVWY